MPRLGLWLSLWLLASFALADPSLQEIKTSASQSYLQTSLQAEQAQQNQISAALARAAPNPTTDTTTAPSPPENCDCYVQSAVNSDASNFLYSQSGQRLFRVKPYCLCLAAAADTNHLPVVPIQQQVHIMNQVKALAPSSPANSGTTPTFNIHY